MFSTGRAGLCILVQIHLSLFSPSSQTQRIQRSLAAPYSHVENPGHSYPCWETHQQGKLVSKAQSSGQVNRHTELPVCELFLFFPLTSSVWPLLFFRWKEGWAWCRDTTSWFWNTVESFKGNKTCHKAPCCHNVLRQLFSRCPTVPSFLTFLPWKGESNLWSPWTWNVSFHKHTFVQL